MHILLTNDDGILAPGLSAMYHALTSLGTVTVAAPDTVQSATAHGITVGQAIAVRRIHVHNAFYGWSVQGRPADCVKIAVHELVDEKLDLIVSGINDGANVSINVLYSGTVAAAAEGALLGYPAVAVSLQRGVETNFDRAASIARKIIDTLIKEQIPPGKLVNVNIPVLEPGLPRGVRVAPQALQVMKDQYERHDEPGGIRQYILGGDFSQPFEQNETDLHALHTGYVVVTPLHVDLTDRARIPSLAQIQWPSFNS